MNRTNRTCRSSIVSKRKISTHSVPGIPIDHTPGLGEHGSVISAHREQRGPCFKEPDLISILGKLDVLQHGIESGGFHVRDIERKVRRSRDLPCSDLGRLVPIAEVGLGENDGGSLRFFQSEKDYPGTSQPGHLECGYAIGCDLSVALALAEMRFWTKKRLDVSGGETGEGSELWLFFVGNEERLAGLEEDPSCRRRADGCVDETLGRPEPGESVEGRTSEEVY